MHAAQLIRVRSLASRSLACLCGLAAVQTLTCPAAAPGPAKNVLMIVVDDLRPELGCYGHPMVKSPNIDRLAARGVLFERAFCQQALCAPSRASVLTGCRPDTTKILDLNHPVQQAAPGVLTMPQFFRKQGYTTISLGKIYHHGDDDPQGWSHRGRPGGEEYCAADNKAWITRRTKEGEAKKLAGLPLYQYTRGPASESADVADDAYRDGNIAAEAVKALRENKGKPLFLAVGFIKPHLPFCAPKRYWDLYRREEIPLPNSKRPPGAPQVAFCNSSELRSYNDIPKRGSCDEATTRRLIHGYYAAVSYVDAQVGRVLDELDRLGMRDDTVVLFWGDHGWKLGEYGEWCKHTNFEYDARAPLIVSAPGMAAGKKTAALVEFLDMYPTLAELCGAKRPGHLEGASFVSLLKDPTQKGKAAAFTQYPRSNLMGHSVRTDRWRYTEWRAKNGRVASRELYDHSQGAFATANLADRPEHAEVVKELSGLLQKVRQQQPRGNGGPATEETRARPSEEQLRAILASAAWELE